MYRVWHSLGRVGAFGGVLALTITAGAAAQDKPVVKQPLPAPPASAAPPVPAAAPAPTPAATATTAAPPAAASAAPAPTAGSTDDIAKQNAIIVSTLIRSTLIALDQANRTGNYTVLRDLAAPTFRDKNSAADLANTFAGLRDQKLDLSAAAVLEAQLTGAPSLDENRMLRLTGTLPTKPSPVSFQLAYLAVDGSWRLSGIAVGPSGPVALALPAVSARLESGGAASSVMPEIRTVLPDPKPATRSKTATKTGTKTATREATSAPMALIPPAPKARPTKTTAN